MPVGAAETVQFIGPVLKNDFNEAYQQSIESFDQKLIDMLATTEAIAGNTARFPFVGDIPQMTRLKDERAEDGFNTYNYSITLGDEWEETVTIKYTVLRDDMTGQLRNRARDLGHLPINNRGKQCINALENGHAALCYDGQYMWDTDHPYMDIDGVTAKTDGTNYATLSLTGANGADNLASTISAMQLFKSDQGTPLGITPSHLFCGPKLQWVGKQLLQSQINVTKPGDGTAGSGATAATGYDNVLKGSLDLVVCPWITNYHWYVFDLTKRVKPLVLVTEDDEPIKFDYLEGNSETAFWKRKYAYGVRDRFEVGYGLWQLGYAQFATS